MAGKTMPAVSGGAASSSIDAKLPALAKLVTDLAAKVQLADVVQLGTSRSAPDFYFVTVGFGGMGQKELEQIGQAAYDALNAFGMDALGRNLLQGKYAIELSQRKNKEDKDGMVTLAMFQSGLNRITVYPNLFEITVVLPKKAVAGMGGKDVEEMVRLYAVVEAVLLIAHEMTHAVQYENNVPGGRISRKDLELLRKLRKQLRGAGFDKSVADSLLDSRHREDILNEGMAVFLGRQVAAKLVEGLGLDSARTGILLFSLSYNASSYVGQVADKSHSLGTPGLNTYAGEVSRQGRIAGGYFLMRNVMRIALEKKSSGRTDDILNSLVAGGYLRREIDSVDTSRKLLDNEYRLGPTLWDIIYVAEDEDLNRALKIMMGCRTYTEFLDAVSSRFSMFVANSLLMKLRGLESV